MGIMSDLFGPSDREQARREAQARDLDAVAAEARKMAAEAANRGDDKSWRRHSAESAIAGESARNTRLAGKPAVTRWVW